MTRDPNELIRRNDWSAYRQAWTPVCRLKKERLLEKRRIYDHSFFPLIAYVLFFYLLILFVGCAQAATLDQWADAIRITEGNPNYGILSVKCSPGPDCRRIAKNTVWHTWLRFNRNNRNSLYKDGKTMAFVNYLANRYCPFSVDPIGNHNWKRNMITLLRRIK